MTSYSRLEASLAVYIVYGNLHVQSFSFLYPYLQGYHAHRAFIAAQSPLQSTVTDFWTLIAEKKVQTVLLLCPLVEDAQVSGSSMNVRLVNSGIVCVLDSVCWRWSTLVLCVRTHILVVLVHTVCVCVCEHVYMCVHVCMCASCMYVSSVPRCSSVCPTCTCRRPVMRSGHIRRAAHWM